jgi:hypothetical protein
MIPSTASTPKRKNATAAARKAADREKCTLLLNRDTSVKLSVAAHLRGLDRSELVNELLAESLRYVVVSIRSQSPGSANPVGELNLTGAVAG